MEFAGFEMVKISEVDGYAYVVRSWEDVEKVAQELNLPVLLDVETEWFDELCAGEGGIAWIDEVDGRVGIMAEA